MTPPHASSATQPGDTNQASQQPLVLSILHTALQHISLLVVVPFIIVVLAVTLTYFLRGYTATTIFLPNSSLSASSLSRLTGLAGELGFNLPSSGDAGTSPAFYSELITSHTILDQVALHKYEFPVSPGSTDTLRGTGMQLLDASGDTPADSLLAAYKALLDIVNVTLDVDAGTVTVTVNSRWPRFAEMMDSLILDRVSEFDLTTRQTQARQERQFLEHRVSDAQKDLTASEDSLEKFQDANRTYQLSPRLVVAAARLQRKIDVRQQVYLTLVQEYESSKIEEVRDTPVITVVASPIGSAQPPIRLLLIAIIALIGGIALAGAIVYLKEVLKVEMATNPAYTQEIKELARRRRNPIHWLRRHPR